MWSDGVARLLIRFVANSDKSGPIRTIDPITKTIDAKSRAGYYPEGGTVTVTLTADRESGRVLGGSLTSEYGEGAVHRSHALVGAVTEGITLSELSNDDLACAPPFNTTWNPVLTAAKVLDGDR